MCFEDDDDDADDDDDVDDDDANNEEGEEERRREKERESVRIRGVGPSGCSSPSLGPRQGVLGGRGLPTTVVPVDACRNTTQRNRQGNSRILGWGP